jgi:hypothetical protein
LPGSAATIDVSAVLNPDHMDGPGVVVHTTNEPVGAAARRRVASDLPAERPSDTPRLLAQRPVTELPDGEGDRHRKVLFECPTGRAVDA